MHQSHTWQQGAVVYQIYPRSFKDSTGNGVGDLRGIINTLDYLGGTPDSLGVTAIWLSPIFVSPMADFGYDVSNYSDVDPIFGTIDDLKTLVTEAHKRSIKVLLDFVPNHSSDEHPWFMESRSSLDNDKRDWYTWRDPNSDGGPPNNWLSVFGGSAWEFDDATGQYYLHSFLSKQPDLNWDNAEVREAMKSAMRFWLDMGVDGFRVDAIDWMSKDPEMRDDPVNAQAYDVVSGYDHGSLSHVFSREGPKLLDRLNEMTTVLAEYEDRFMITEAHPESDDKISGYLKYYRGVNPLLNSPFNFESIYLPWNAHDFKAFINRFQAHMESSYVPVYTVGNHDESRIGSRVGAYAARTAAVMLMSLPGMVFIYYGEEIGMHDVYIPEDRIRDPFAGKQNGRDPQRTPMQWDDSSEAGFTTGTPWLPVSDDFSQINLQAAKKDPDSIFNLYRRLIKLREQSAAISRGVYEPIEIHDQVLAYRRVSVNDAVYVLLNYSDSALDIDIGEIRGRVLVSTHRDAEQSEINRYVSLRPNEGMIIQI